MKIKHKKDCAFHIKNIKIIYTMEAFGLHSSFEDDKSSGAIPLDDLLIKVKVIVEQKDRIEKFIRFISQVQKRIYSWKNFAENDYLQTEECLDDFICTHSTILDYSEILETLPKLQENIKELLEFLP